MTSAIFNTLLNTSAVIYRHTRSRTDTGEFTSSLTLITSTPARLDTFRYSGSPNVYAEQGIVDLPSHKLWLEPGVDLRQGDTVEVAGISYEVLEVWEPGGVRHHKEAWVKNV
ncbi:MAG: hypothetical protein AB1384_12435 [Actinomycetota bacterium]